MSITRTCRVGDLQPGMGAYDERLRRHVRVERVEVDGDVAIAWLSNDGREPVPFPYDVDDEVTVDVTPAGSDR